MAYIILIIGSLLIMAAIGNQAIKYGGNDYFGLDCENFAQCLGAGFGITLKVFAVISFFVVFIWAIGEI